MFPLTFSHLQSATGNVYSVDCQRAEFVVCCSLLLTAEIIEMAFAKFGPVKLFRKLYYFTVSEHIVSKVY